MVKVFKIQTTHKNLVNDLDKALCQRIMDIQQKGWKILSITPVATVEYDEDLKEWFDSKCYVVITERNYIADGGDNDD